MHYYVYDSVLVITALKLALICGWIGSNYLSLNLGYL